TGRHHRGGARSHGLGGLPPAGDDHLRGGRGGPAPSLRTLRLLHADAASQDALKAIIDALNGGGAVGNLGFAPVIDLEFPQSSAQIASSVAALRIAWQASPGATSSAWWSRPATRTGSWSPPAGSTPFARPWPTWSTPAQSRWGSCRPCR